ncbi:MAG: HU family DNA-binding protein [Proteobacteria bacterium]|nr:HU family DNA-binding protein [Pseudomonadota bacterium]
MNKSELLSQVTEKMKLNHSRVVSKADVEALLASLVEVTQNALAKGDEVSLPGLGKFSVIERAEREGRNPRTGETIKIAASRAPKFSPGKELKTAINLSR